MKWFTAIVLLAASAYSVSGTKQYHLTEEEFESQFHVKISDPDDRAKAEEQLIKVEQEVNQVNKEYDEGKKTYYERIYPESNLPTEEFEKEKEGVIAMPADEIPTLRNKIPSRALGAILPPAHIRDDPENAAKMNEIHRKLAMNRNTLPESYNAVEEGLITPPKNQQSCGSCAAFAAHGLHETCMLKAGASFTNLVLSEQYIIDCGYNPNEGMNACNGAWVHAYSKWFANNGGESAHESAYPYLGRNPLKNCNKAVGLEWNSGAKVDTAVYDYSSNAEKLKSLLVENGAVMIALHVDSGFSNYAGGIYDGCTNTQINHGVLLVGYGNEGGVDYWLVKNSWGKNWGDNGYIKIKRGVNMCGMEKISVITTCSKTGEDAEPAPTPPTPAPIPAELECDISGIFGAGLSGRYNLRYRSCAGDGTEYYSEVTCENSMCTPRNPGPSNACMYICGKLKCTESKDGDDDEKTTPAVTTKKPVVTSTKKPDVTTKKPVVTSTKKPVVTSTKKPDVTTPEPEEPESYESVCNIQNLIKRKRFNGRIVVAMTSAAGDTQYVVSKCKKSVCPLEVPTGTVACEYICGKSAEKC